MRRVLVLEDESAIREFIVINLERGGYEVVQAEDGKQALAIFESENFDVVLLDVMVPLLDGLEVCKQLRAESPTLGIIILSAKGQEMDKLKGLMNGADDYITKPFSPSELVARVDAVYRRVSVSNQYPRPNTHILRSGNKFELNTLTRTLFKSGQKIELTQLEYQLMEYFLLNIEVPLSRTAILDKIWGNNYIGEDKIVDVNVRRLRKKLEEYPSEPKHLQTVWGCGYKWCV
ncbi:MAG: response regulator transcription factor [Oscillospiraceae bacterium]|nr:response regulator transcription factor [Oscillospiraceae bacterium]